MSARQWLLMRNAISRSIPSKWAERTEGRGSGSTWTATKVRTGPGAPVSSLFCCAKLAIAWAGRCQSRGPSPAIRSRSRPRRKGSLSVSGAVDRRSLPKARSSSIGARQLTGPILESPPGLPAGPSRPSKVIPTMKAAVRASRYVPDCAATARRISFVSHDQFSPNLDVGSWHDPVI